MARKVTDLARAVMRASARLVETVAIERTKAERGADGMAIWAVVFMVGASLTFWRR